ncbi:MAG: Crp/Fnr family transcriptional regulator [Pseudomonadota bacterium]
MTPEQLLSYELPLFEGLAPADFGKLSLDVTPQTLTPWQTIIDQEDDSFDLYFLLSGSLLAVFWTTQGREIVFSRFQIGAYFGELAAFDGVPRSLAVVAKTNAEVLAMKRACFLQLFNEVPVIRDRIVRNLVARVRTLTRRNMEMTTLSVEDRVRIYLLRLAAEQDKLSTGAIIDNAPTHAEIAGSVGANREMVSRSISKLAKNGIIKPARQRIEILDPEALSAEADET